jgi:hypothetical protein
MNPAVPYLRTKITKGLSANWMKTLLQLLLTANKTLIIKYVILILSNFFF